MSDASHGENGSGSSVHRPSLVREYFHTEPRKLLYLVAAFVGVLVVVTIPYVLLVGFDKWANDMGEASRMIWASYTPAAAKVAAPSPLPVPATPNMMLNVPTPYWTAPADELIPLAPLPSAGRQYVCTNCGGLGLPVWSSNGQPLCPYCRGLMAVAPLGLRDELTFAPVYTPGKPPTVGMFWGN